MKLIGYDGAGFDIPIERAIELTLAVQNDPYSPHYAIYARWRKHINK